MNQSAGVVDGQHDTELFVGGRPAPQTRLVIIDNRSLHISDRAS